MGCGSPIAGRCLIANFTPGCDDFDCCEAVCMILPSCCSVSWDTICANQIAPLQPECLP